MNPRDPDVIKADLKRAARSLRLDGVSLREAALRYGVAYPWPARQKLTTQQRYEMMHKIDVARAEQKKAQAAARRGDHGHTLRMAESILDKFGGARRVAHALQQLHVRSGDPADQQYIRSYHTIRKWTLPKWKRGMDGMIPHQLWLALIRAARYEGIVLTAQDFLPELMDPPEVFVKTRQGRTAPTP